MSDVEEEYNDDFNAAMEEQRENQSFGAKCKRFLQRKSIVNIMIISGISFVIGGIAFVYSGYGNEPDNGVCDQYENDKFIMQARELLGDTPRQKEERTHIKSILKDAESKKNVLRHANHAETVNIHDIAHDEDKVKKPDGRTHAEMRNSRQEELIRDVDDRLKKLRSELDGAQTGDSRFQVGKNIRKAQREKRDILGGRTEADNDVVPYDEKSLQDEKELRKESIAALSAEELHEEYKDLKEQKSLLQEKMSQYGRQGRDENMADMQISLDMIQMEIDEADRDLLAREEIKRDEYRQAQMEMSAEFDFVNDVGDWINTIKEILVEDQTKLRRLELRDTIDILKDDLEGQYGQWALITEEEKIEARKVITEALVDFGAWEEKLRKEDPELYELLKRFV